MNKGYTQVDQGSYFDTPEFTITVWVYPRDVGKWARAIDFYNFWRQNNVILSFDSDLSKKPSFQILSFLLFSTYIKVGEVTSSSPLNDNQWQFLTTTFDGKITCLYIDGNLMGSLLVTYTMPKISRSVD